MEFFAAALLAELGAGDVRSLVSESRLTFGEAIERGLDRVRFAQVISAELAGEEGRPIGERGPLRPTSRHRAACSIRSASLGKTFRSSGT